MISTMMASLMLSDCRRKEKRLAVIMLPALSSEKYLSRIMLVLSGIVAGLVIHTVVYYLLVALHFIFQNSAGFMKGAALRSDIFSPIGFADVTINGNKIDTHVLSNLVTVKSPRMSNVAHIVLHSRRKLSGRKEAGS